MSSSGADSPRGGSGWFTYGRWMRGGAAAVGGQILLLSYVIGFGLSVFDALVALLQQAHGASSTAQRQAPAAALGGYLFLLALALLAATFGMRTANRRLGLSPAALGLRSDPVTRRRAPVAAVIYVSLLAAAIELTTSVLDWCGIHGSGADGGLQAGPGVLPVETVHAAIAGLVEEPVLLALLLAIARRGRWPWPVTLVVMITMRIAFHVYLGWDCLFVLPWMLGALALYRWCSLVCPLVIGHGLFDVLQTLQTYGDRATVDIARAVLISAVAGGAVAAAGVVRARLRVYECQRRTMRRPQSLATSERPG